MKSYTVHSWRKGTNPVIAAMFLLLVRDGREKRQPLHVYLLACMEKRKIVLPGANYTPCICYNLAPVEI